MTSIKKGRLEEKLEKIRKTSCRKSRKELVIILNIKRWRQMLKVKKADPGLIRDVRKAMEENENGKRKNLFLVR